MDYLLKELESCAPKLDDLLKLGLSSSESNEFLLSFVAKKRQDCLQNDFGLGRLGELIQHYDLSGIVIGMVRFFNIPQCGQEQCFIGKVEADWLVVDKLSNQVLVLEAGAEYNLLWECALDGEHLFSALVKAACFFSRCLTNEEFVENMQERERCITECVKLAGGAQYKKFYQMLLG